MQSKSEIELTDGNEWWVCRNMAREIGIKTKKEKKRNGKTYWACYIYIYNQVFQSSNAERNWAHGVGARNILLRYTWSLFYFLSYNLSYIPSCTNDVSSNIALRNLKEYQNKNLLAFMHYGRNALVLAFTIV